MQHIHKQLSREPNSLREHRATPGASYDDCDKGPIREVLLDEQGHLCAYCMKRITQARMDIEHYHSQYNCKADENPKLALAYMNMLGVCNQPSAGVWHCDKTKGKHGKADGRVCLRKLDPRKKDVERLLTYGTSGEIKSVNGDPDVTHDLTEVLNLNAPSLVKQRKDIIDRARKELIKNHRNKKTDWTKQHFQQEIDRWRAKSGGKHQGFYLVAVWWLTSQQSKRSH
ncbi:MAG: retron system putative HNH endonuclease [Bacteroidota bacterium]